MRPSFVFHATAATAIYTLSLHDALPICQKRATKPTARMEAAERAAWQKCSHSCRVRARGFSHRTWMRSEEHTSELQSRRDLVCRLLLEKKKDGNRRRTLAARTWAPGRGA